MTFLCFLRRKNITIVFAPTLDLLGRGDNSTGARILVPHRLNDSLSSAYSQTALIYILSTTKRCRNHQESWYSTDGNPSNYQPCYIHFYVIFASKPCRRRGLTGLAYTLQPFQCRQSNRWRRSTKLFEDRRSCMDTQFNCTSSSGLRKIKLRCRQHLRLHFLFIPKEFRFCENCDQFH